MKFSMISWNVQGTKHYTSTKFQKIRPILENSQADIFCFQEGQGILNHREDIKWKKNLRYEAFLEDSEGGNLILSRFPIIQSQNITFQHLNKRPSGKVIRADVKIEEKIVRIYNCHFGIVGIGPRERAKSLKTIIKDSETTSGPIIICGDLNTTIPAKGWRRRIIQSFHKEPPENPMDNPEFFDKDERYHIQDIARRYGFRDNLKITQSTWSLPFRFEFAKLKLDWFLTKGVEGVSCTLNKYVSDHRMISADLLIKD
jgi:endonuclease/exonuclease/phosphatase family metal-dependent hydrolase